HWRCCGKRSGRGHRLLRRLQCHKVSSRRRHRHQPILALRVNRLRLRLKRTTIRQISTFLQNNLIRSTSLCPPARTSVKLRARPAAGVQSAVAAETLGLAAVAPDVSATSTFSATPRASTLDRICHAYCSQCE